MNDREQAALEATIAEHLDGRRLGEAATAALRGYGSQIFGYLIAVLRDEEQAHEVFSQFAEDLWRGIGGFRRESSFRTWSYKLAWHAARRFNLDPFRRRGRHLETTEYSKLAEEIRQSTAAFRKTEAKDELARIRETLEPAEQTLLILRLGRGLSWREVAEVMGEPGQPLDETVLWKRFERLKKKVRKKMEERGFPK
jgi:RNA polymerase sigma-70 factor (ECF subfamily)